MFLFTIFCTIGLSYGTCINTSLSLNPHNWICETNTPGLGLCEKDIQPFCRANGYDECFAVNTSAQDWFFYFGATIFSPLVVPYVAIIPRWKGDLSGITIGSFYLHRSKQVLEMYVNENRITDFSRPYYYPISKPPTINVSLHFPPGDDYTSLTFWNIFIHNCL